MLRILAPLALLLALHAPHYAAAAVSVVSDVVNMRVVNGVYSGVRLTTFSCPRSSWGTTQTFEVRTPTNKTQTMEVTCGPYRDEYVGTLVGWVPASGRLFEQEVCYRSTTDRDSVEFLSSRFNIAPTSVAPQGRAMPSNRLRTQTRARDARLGLQVSFGDDNYFPKNPVNVFVGSKFGSKYDLVRRDLVQMVPYVGGVVNAVIDIFGSSPYANLINAIRNLQNRAADVETQIAIFRQRSAAYEAAFTEFYTTFTEYRATNRAVLESLSDRIDVAQETAELALFAVDALRYEFVLSRDAQLQLTKTLHTSTQILRARTNGLSSNVQTLTALVGEFGAETEERIRDVYNELAAITGVTRELFTEVYSAINNSTLQVDDRIRRLARAQGTADSALARALLDSERMETLTYMVHVSMAELEANSTSWAPFLEDLGVRPTPDALLSGTEEEPDAYQTLEELDLFYAPELGGGLVHHTRLRLVCNMYYVVNIQTPVTAWRDLLDALGPAYCGDPRAYNKTALECFCRVEVADSSCTPASPALRTVVLSGQGGVASLNTTLCTAPPLVYPTATYVTPSTLVDALSTICALGTLPGTRVRVSSVLRRQSYFALPGGAACTFDVTDVREGSVDGFNAPFVVMQLLQYALAVAAANRDVYSDLLVGRMPSGLTHRSAPVAVVDGQPGRCISAAFMAFDARAGTMLPVISYAKQTAGARATVRLNGALYDVGTDALASRRLAIAPDAFVSVGRADHTTEAYDIPQSQLPISQNPNARAGAVTYALLPTRTSNASDWKRANGARFDAYAGSVVASDFRRLVYSIGDDTLDGRCVGESPYSTDDSICRIKENARFTPANSGYDVYLTATGADEFYEVTLETPAGDLVGVVYSACPSISVRQLTGSSHELVLANTAPQALDLVVATSGRCDAFEAEVRVGANAQYSTTIRDCIQNRTAEDQAPVWLDVRTLDGASCPDFPRELSLNRTEFVITYGVADAAYVTKSSTVLEDRLRGIMRANLLAIAELTASMTLVFLDTASINRLQAPSYNDTGLNDTLALIMALGRELARNDATFEEKMNLNEAEYERVLQQFESNNKKFDSQWLVMQERFADVIARAAQAANTSSNAFLNLTAVEAKLQNASDTLVAANSAYQRALLAFLDAQAAFNRATVSTFEALWDTLGYGDKAGTLAFIILLLFVLIACAVACFRLHRRLNALEAARGPARPPPPPPDGRRREWGGHREEGEVEAERPRREEGDPGFFKTLWYKLWGYRSVRGGTTRGRT